MFQRFLPHGSSKSELPFFGTLLSTSKVIKEKSSYLGLKSVEKSIGGILDAKYPGELPRNELQVSNYKRHEFVKDSKTPLDLKVMSYTPQLCYRLRLILRIKIRSSFEMLKYFQNLPLL